MSIPTDKKLYNKTKKNILFLRLKIVSMTHFSLCLHSEYGSHNYLMLRIN